MHHFQNLYHVRVVLRILPDLYHQSRYRDLSLSAATRSEPPCQSVESFPKPGKSSGITAISHTALPTSVVPPPPLPLSQPNKSCAGFSVSGRSDQNAKRRNPSTMSWCKANKGRWDVECLRAEREEEAGKGTDRDWIFSSLALPISCLLVLSALMQFDAAQNRTHALLRNAHICVGQQKPLRRRQH